MKKSALGYTEFSPNQESDHSRVHIVDYCKSPSVITLDTDYALKLQAQADYSLEHSVPISDVLKQIPPSALTGLIDEKSWPDIAKFMLQSAPSLSETGSKKLDPTPSDIPTGLAFQRLSTFEQLLPEYPEYTDVIVELMEVMMADRNNRQLNADLMRAESENAPAFMDYLDDPLCDLDDQIESLKQRYENLVSESSPSSLTPEIAGHRVAISELLYCANRHPENLESPRLG